jgi:hypothetical protein
MSLRDIAEAIGKRLKLPVVSIPAEKAGEPFEMFFGHAATRDMPGFERVDAQVAGVESDRAGADGGFGEYEVGRH